MKKIIDFYTNLDFLNLIIFWGIIAVIILLIIFAIVLINRTKNLKKLITNDEIKPEDSASIEEENLLSSKELTPIIQEDLTNKKDNEQREELFEESIKVEKNFVAEEHVIEYDNDLFSLDNIKKVNEIKDEPIDYEIPKKKEIIMPTGPYQKNVLREMSLGQTSPIGIIKKQQPNEKTYDEAKELQESLDIPEEFSMPEENPEEKPVIDEPEEIISEEVIAPVDFKEQIEEEFSMSEEKPEEKPVIDEPEEIISEEVIAPVDFKKQIEEEFSNSEEQASNNYIEEVSKKLASAEEPTEIDRTAYEIQQEEEAIISYEELMKKKDKLKMIEEEDAVISIEELMKRKEEEDKLYKISEDESTENFINELKNFRNDL